MKQNKSKFNFFTETLFKINIFKIIAIVVLILFSLIVIGGLVRYHQFKESFTKIDEAQTNLAKDIALQDLEIRGKNGSSYDVQIMPRINMMRKECERKEKYENQGNEDKGNKTKSMGKCLDRNETKIRSEGKNESSKSMVQINFRNQTEMQSYLIDLNSKKIVMHSETNYYEGFNGGFDFEKTRESSRWVHQGFN